MSTLNYPIEQLRSDNRGDIKMLTISNEQIDKLNQAVRDCHVSNNLDPLRAWVADLPEDEWRLLPNIMVDNLFQLLA